MRIVSLLILVVLLIAAKQRTTSPHGPKFKVSCNSCHSAQGWQLDKKIYSFNHDLTSFPLTGQHAAVDCRMCHLSLVFAEARSGCIDCHTDIHQATAGLDCSRCHTTASWLVNNITDIHQKSRFQLLGPHKSADCYDCHKSESMTRFDVTGINCIDCHRQDYNAASNPNHVQAGFSNDCLICHPVNSYKWSGSGFDHAFFALVEGHSNSRCEECHTSGNYSSTSPECVSCHKTDYDNTLNPRHSGLGFSLICTQCHTLQPGWKPATYTQHDSQSFPIYSGTHRGEWSNCTDCHASTSSYSQFTCINCHEHNKAEMDSKHSGRAGYSYDSPSCFRCHPTGRGD